MADNYLEKKMQDHASGAQRIAKAPRSHISAVVFVHLHSLPAASGLMQAVRALAEAGAKIGICIEGASQPEGSRFAQTVGARYLPYAAPEALAYLARTWRIPDLYLTDQF